MLRHESGLPFFGETIKLDDFSTESIKRNSVGELIARQELVSKVLTTSGNEDKKLYDT